MNISHSPGLIFIGGKNYPRFRPIFAQFFPFSRASRLRPLAPLFQTRLGSFFQNCPLRRTRLHKPKVVLIRVKVAQIRKDPQQVGYAEPLRQGGAILVE